MGMGYMKLTPPTPSHNPSIVAWCATLKLLITVLVTSLFCIKAISPDYCNG